MFPTVLAELDGRLLIVNSQLSAGGKPVLPFAVLDVALPSHAVGVKDP